ncbi:MAG: hypothetical protein IKI52_00680 [Clostridia bacterium]|jgi:hypothetical protein|nr:hypothetical protein [Clostridia bacterium]MBR3037192.1 hypothetical protein [Clostridia bacterium]
MRLLRGIGTLIALTVLCAALMLTLVAGPLRFIALNPAYLKTFVPSRDYCEEMRQRISDDLDHVAILYGLENGELTDLVTDDSIRAYTGTLIDALFAPENTDSLHLPSYPAERFAEYLREHSAYSDKAIEDFSEDCAAAVTEDLSAIDASLLISKFTTFRDSMFVNMLPILFGAGVALTILMCAIIRLLYVGTSKRAGSVLMWGGCFMGVTLVLVPVTQFLLFDYVGRLNITVSAFRTILSGLLYTVLYGWLIVLLALFLFVALFLTIAILRAARTKKK